MLRSVNRKIVAMCLLGVGLSIPVIVFAAYAARFGLRGLSIDLSDESYIYTQNAPLINYAIFAHMVLGGAVMIIAPLQLFKWVRRDYPHIHRIMGRMIIAGSIMIALGGMIYIAQRGTLAGTLMDAGFALYGGFLFLAAVQTIRFARAKDYQRHQEWALRLIVLIMGSLMYRLHYVFWYILTNGRWSNEQLNGPFDQVQYFAFYVPYLAALEWRIISRRGQDR